MLEQAIRLSPRDPFIAAWYHRIGTVHLLQSRIDEAILWCERARAANPAHSVVCSDLASAYVLKGETEHAAAELAEARRLSGDDRFLSIARIRAQRCWGAPKTRALWEGTYLAGLRKADAGGMSGQSRPRLASARHQNAHGIGVEKQALSN